MAFAAVDALLVGTVGAPLGAVGAAFAEVGGPVGTCPVFCVTGLLVGGGRPADGLVAPLAVAVGAFAPAFAAAVDILLLFY